MLIEFTKSRPRKSGDNGLVESKNGSIIRKLFGYMYISQQCAEIMNTFNTTYLNYYLNYRDSKIKIIKDLKGVNIKAFGFHGSMS